MKEKIIKNDYYNASWSIGKFESLFGILLVLIFNVVEIIAINKVPNFDSALIVFTFFDVIVFVAYYFAYKIPCVKFAVDRPKPEETEDITQKQRKYRNMIIIAMIIVMIYGIMQTFASGSVVIER